MRPIDPPPKKKMSDHVATFQNHPYRWLTGALLAAFVAGGGTATYLYEKFRIPNEKWQTVREIEKQRPIVDRPKDGAPNALTPATVPSLSSTQPSTVDPIASSLSDKPLVVVYPTWIHLGGHLPVDALDVDIRFDFSGIMRQLYVETVKGGDKIPTLHVNATNVLTTLPLTEVNVFGFVTDTSLHFETNWFTTTADPSHRYILWALCLHPDMKDILVMVTRDNRTPPALHPGVVSPDVAAKLKTILPADASAALEKFLLPSSASSSRPTPP